MTWLGTADKNILTAPDQSELGPLRQVVEEKGFDTICLMSNRTPEITGQCVAALKKWRKKVQIKVFQYEDFDPTDYELVLKYTEETLCSILPETGNEDASLTFFATPGTPMMVAVLCLMAERLPNVSLIQTSKESGVKYVKWSTPNFLNEQRVKQIEEASLAETPDCFQGIVFSSEKMKIVLSQALRYARYNIPVLLLGETGTGKSMIAERIHKASKRTGKFVSVNCGAIPESLLEGELFGTKKGAYTGAIDKKGKIEEADKGTLFLDEIGEMPLTQQVKLLQVLQEKKVTRLGENAPRDIDVRIVAATNRNLPQMVLKGTFREDLFYRLAVAMLKMPPLRDRGAADIINAAENSLLTANKMLFEPNEKEYKVFSDNVRLFISSERWPGNFRELNNVILRAVLNSSGKELTVQDIRDAMLDDSEISCKNEDGPVLPQYTSDGSFNLEDALNRVEKHFIELALKDSGRKKLEAARLLGIKNYQNLSTRMKKYGL